MRSVSIQPLSLALGLVLATVGFFSMGQATITPSTLGSTVRVEYMPHPRDMVQIKGGVPYTVPSGTLLALTALGGSNLGPYDPRLLINGQAEVIAVSAPTNDTASMKPLPVGLTAQPGSLVEIQDAQGGNPQNYRAWGYLAPQ